MKEVIGRTIKVHLSEITFETGPYRIHVTLPVKDVSLIDLVVATLYQKTKFCIENGKIVQIQTLEETT